jgi:hypothetical protein
MKLHDGENDRKAKPGTLSRRLGRDERPEHALPYLRGHVAPGVFDGHRDVFPGMTSPGGTAGWSVASSASLPLGLRKALAATSPGDRTATEGAITTPGHVTPADFAPRLAAVRQILLEREATAAIIMGPEAQYWLCGLDPSWAL